MGPTGSGKTALACFLASKINFEIVSVDSVLVYKGLNIGAAKPTKDVLAKFPHHLIDISEPDSNYSVGNFYTDINKVMSSIYKRGNIPLLVGGTAMYFHILQNGMHHLPESSVYTRDKLLNYYGLSDYDLSLHDHLTKIDPIYAKSVSIHDKQRVIRALDVYHQTGRTLTSFQQDNKRSVEYDFKNFILLPPRDELKKILRERLDVMIEDGFLQEVAALKKNKSLDLTCSSIRSVGYKEAWAHLDGDTPYSEFKEKAYISTCQLAKRQYTWFKKWDGIKIYSLITENEMLSCLHDVKDMLL